MAFPMIATAIAMPLVFPTIARTLTIVMAMGHLMIANQATTAMVQVFRTGVNWEATIAMPTRSLTIVNLIAIKMALPTNAKPIATKMVNPTIAKVLRTVMAMAFQTTAKIWKIATMMGCLMLVKMEKTATTTAPLTDAKPSTIATQTVSPTNANFSGWKRFVGAARRRISAQAFPVPPTACWTPEGISLSD